MADIIPFTPPERSGDAPRAGEPAAIVIFPGVRYERAGSEETRNDESPQSGTGPGRRGRRRKLS